ncbi:hypothetical protein NKDENANG_01720 [Candidatus Entotheonellaceae bacterium PAL068K]
MIKPSKASERAFKHRMKQEWTELIGHNAKTVIKKLKPIITGWANYFRISVASRSFSELDNWMWKRAYRWCRRNHTNQVMELDNPNLLWRVQKRAKRQMGIWRAT